MDYVARAKALLMGKARTGALLVLPLAAAVQQAQAVQVGPSINLPTGNLSCNTQSGACVSGGDLQLGTRDGIEGVGFFDDFPTDFSGNSYVDFGSSGILTSTGSGGLTALPAGSILTSSYDFNIGNVSGSGSDTWSLSYQIFDSTTLHTVVSDSSASGSGTGSFSASFTDQLASAMTVGDTLSITADLNLTASSGSIFSVTIPSGLTLDVGQDVSTTPEPSTLSFGALALALAGIWRGLRRKRTADLQ